MGRGAVLLATSAQRAGWRVGGAAACRDPGREQYLAGVRWAGGGAPALQTRVELFEGHAAGKHLGNVDKGNERQGIFSQKKQKKKKGYYDSVWGLLSSFRTRLARDASLYFGHSFLL